MQSSKHKMPVTDVDVAIVGGGVSGCYAAWRLINTRKEDLPENSPLRQIWGDKKKLDIHLYEYLDRIGGRLWSVMLDREGFPGEFTEFGGMRYFEQMHIVAQLVDHLGVGGKKIPFPVDLPENISFVRNKHLRNTQLETSALAEDPSIVPYNLRYVEQGKSASDLVTYVCDFAVPGFSTMWTQYQDAFSKNDWTKVTELRDRYERAKKDSMIDGVPLLNWGWWGLVSRVLSNEALDFVQDTGGYNTYASTGSAIAQLDETFYFPETIHYHRLEHGFESLPQGLCKKFHAADGKYHLLNQLVRFDKTNDGYEMLFYRRRDGGEDRAPSHKEYTAAHEARSHIVRAKMVVLALPQRSLALLDQNTFFFGHGLSDKDGRYAKLRKAMSSVVPVQAFKIFMSYDYPWWESVGVSKGRSTTDLPMRQMYYWATEANAETTGAPHNMESLIMATYDTAEAATHWRSLEAGEPFPSRTPAKRFFTASSPASALLAREVDAPQARTLLPTATRLMIGAAHRQVMQLHGVAYAPEPFDAHYQDWTVDPFGGGWHRWNPGANEYEVIPYMQHPFADERVYIVGECWSNVQGWVQGALNTTESMLQNSLGLSWPSWLERGGTWLGPGSKT